MSIEIRFGDLEDPAVIEMVRFHVQQGRAHTEEGSAHALDTSGLSAPDVQFWTASYKGALAGMGALKRLSASEGEVKSMHTLQTLRRSGVATAMLNHILQEARALGLSRLSLETGSWDYFKPAVALYARHGFVECGPFGAYKPDPNSLFMTIDLETLRDRAADFDAEAATE